MNVYDSEKIVELMTNNGYRQSSNLEESDIAIFNTCHIREKQQKNSFLILEEFLNIKRIK